MAIATLPRLPGPHQTGDAERRVRPEHLRVEEQVVDAPVDHVDRFETVDRAHVHPITVVDDQVAAFDEGRAHALGEERVLEVRRVEDPRGEHGDRRVAHPVGGERAEQAVELVGVGIDRLDALAGEHLGEGALGDGTVLQHVAHAGRNTEVVLQHVQRAVGVAHEVGSGDVRPHAELGVDAPALRAEVGRVGEQLGREHTVRHDALVVVEVVDEPVEGHETLDEAALDRGPFGGLDHPGDDVERPRPVDAAGLGVHGERDPESEDVGRRRGLAGPELIEAEVVDDGEQLLRRRPRPTVTIAQLVPGWAGRGSLFHPPPTLGEPCFGAVKCHATHHRLRDG